MSAQSITEQAQMMIPAGDASPGDPDYLDQLEAPYALFVGSIQGWKSKPPCAPVLFVRDEVTLWDLTTFLGVGVTAVNGSQLGLEDDVVVYLRMILPAPGVVNVVGYNAIADWILKQPKGSVLGPAIICKGVTAS